MRERATAEIEAEKARAIADAPRRGGRPRPAAAGSVVGETMTDERERRLVEEFLAERLGTQWRLVATDGPPRDSPPAATPRPPSRSPCATTPSSRGGASSTRPRPIVAEDAARARARQPGHPARDAARTARASSSARSSRPGLNLIGLMLRRGRIEQLPRVAAEFRRLDDRAAGHHPRHRHQRRAADRRRDPGAHRSGWSR